MKYRSFLVLSYFLLPFLLLAQNAIRPEYKFLDKTDKADLNYAAIDSINLNTGGIIKLSTTFNAIKGKYTIYRFMSYYRGVSFDEKVRDMNELIILKVDKKNKIIDGYQYLLQTSEMPFSCHLYRLSKKKKLMYKIKITDLKFIRVYKEIPGYEVCQHIPMFLKDDRYLSF